MKRVLHIGKPMLFLPIGVRLIVNRDCSDLNVMYDAPGMYSEGFYPVRTDRVAIYDRQASPLHRRVVPSVRYYFTDFGISSKFDDSGERRVVTGRACLDKEVPELVI